MSMVSHLNEEDMEAYVDEYSVKPKNESTDPTGY